MSAGIGLVLGTLLLGQAAPDGSELEARYGRLIEQLMCDCPSENWTRNRTRACRNS